MQTTTGESHSFFGFSASDFETIKSFLQNVYHIELEVTIGSFLFNIIQSQTLSSKGWNWGDILTTDNAFIFKNGEETVRIFYFVWLKLCQVFEIPFTEISQCVPTSTMKSELAIEMHQPDDLPEDVQVYTYQF